LVSTAGSHLATLLLPVLTVQALRLGLELADTFLSFLIFMNFLRCKDIEDRSGYMLFMEVNFIRFSTLLAESSWRIPNHLNNGLIFDILIFDLLEFFVELHKLKLDIVEDIEFFMIEEFLLVIDPDILEFYVVEVVEDLFYLVLVLEFGDGREVLVVLFVLQVVLAGDWILEDETAVFGLEGCGVEA
jgi:hypothetical protein